MAFSLRESGDANRGAELRAVDVDLAQLTMNCANSGYVENSRYLIGRNSESSAVYGPGENSVA